MQIEADGSNDVVEMKNTWICLLILQLVLSCMDSEKNYWLRVRKYSERVDTIPVSIMRNTSTYSDELRYETEYDTIHYHIDLGDERNSRMYWSYESIDFEPFRRNKFAFKGLHYDVTCFSSKNEAIDGNVLHYWNSDLGVFLIESWSNTYVLNSNNKSKTELINSLTSRILLHSRWAVPSDDYVSHPAKGTPFIHRDPQDSTDL
jgi:hypothetical protein